MHTTVSFCSLNTNCKSTNVNLTYICTSSLINHTTFIYHHLLAGTAWQKRYANMFLILHMWVVTVSRWHVQLNDVNKCMSLFNNNALQVFWRQCTEPNIQVVSGCISWCGSKLGKLTSRWLLVATTTTDHVDHLCPVSQIEYCCIWCLISVYAHSFSMLIYCLWVYQLTSNDSSFSSTASWHSNFKASQQSPSCGSFSRNVPQSMWVIS